MDRGLLLSKVEKYLLVFFATITPATVVALIISALVRPINLEFAFQIRTSYVCNAVAATIAFLVSLSSSQSERVKIWLIAAIEAYIIGMVAQLFSIA